jgi:CBS domain-containing protein
MKRNVAYVSPQDTVETAATRMRDDNIGFLPVCDATNKVVGTVTDRDLTIRVLAERRVGSTPIDDVLTREVIACRPEDDLDKAEELMAKHHKSRIMCVDAAGRLLGVISLSDIAQEEPGARTAQTLRQVSQREARA